MVLIIAYLALKLVGLIKVGNRRDRDRYDSLNILRMRYARGDISEREFIKMRDLLFEPSKEG